MIKARKFISVAILEAQKAASNGDVPIGAVAVFKGKIIARSHNQVYAKSNVCLHAEMVLIDKLSKHFDSHRFDDLGVDIYVTVEPCRMCATALSFARISRIYFGILEPKFGGLITNPLTSAFFKPEVYYGFCEEEITTLMQDFFTNKK
jgi:tRNA(Arg) A34 adenosine deaminase TadA